MTGKGTETVKSLKEQVLDTAKIAKEKLLEAWEGGYTGEEHKFIDSTFAVLDNATKEVISHGKEGIMTHSTGFASLLVLCAAFGEEKFVFPEKEMASFSEKIEKMYGDLLEKVKNEGYSVTPYLDTDKTFFGGNGCTDTATWIFSCSLILRYLMREHQGKHGTIKKKITFKEITQQQIFDVIAESFDLMMQAQRADGTWGFALTPDSVKSLYYTYSVNAAISDFYNYALGEVAGLEYSKEEEEDAKVAAIAADRDVELLDYLDKKLGYKTSEKINEARTKLQSWLVRDCLLLMPKVADCISLTEEEKALLGIRDPLKLKKNDLEKAGFCYLNLYYAYYLIDMFIDSAADEYYKQLKPDSEEMKTIRNELENLQNAKKDVRMKEYDYYFVQKYVDENGETKPNYDKLWLDYLERAIHTSRTKYMYAARTGKVFWDGSASELPLVQDWEFEGNVDEEIEDALNEAVNKLAQTSSRFTDPVLVPMALRANTQYCYYISEQKDKMVENLFEKIKSDRYSIESESSSLCVRGLWDTQAFNLFITERSIEALVDFSDYVNKYYEEESDSATATAASVPTATATEGFPIAATSFDALMQAMIEKRVNEIVEAKITEYFEKNPPVAGSAPMTTGGFGDFESFADTVMPLIEDLLKIKNDTKIPLSGAERKKEQFFALLVELYDAIQLFSQRTMMVKWQYRAEKKEAHFKELKEIENTDFITKDRRNDIVGRVDSYNKAFAHLFAELIDDSTKEARDARLSNLYKRLKEIQENGI